MNLEYLWQLQEIDQKLIKTEQESKQRELVLGLKKAYGQIQEKEEFLKEFNKEITGLEEKAEKYEEELKALNEQKKNFEDRLYSSNTNIPKEMESLGNKILELEDKINKIEEKTLAIMDIDEDKSQIANIEKTLLEKLKKDYQKGYKKYKITKDKLEQEKVLLKTQRKEIVALISEEILEKYNHLQEKFKFTGIAQIENGRCSGCKIDIPRMQLKNIQQREREVHCEYCNRLLLDEIQNK